MTEYEKKQLDTLEEMLGKMISKYSELKREYHELEQVLENTRKENAKILAGNEKLQSDYANLKAAMTISLNGSDAKETKLRLSKLVREVDKCIALLNE